MSHFYADADRELSNDMRPIEFVFEDSRLPPKER
jgi:hypothetical protein